MKLFIITHQRFDDQAEVWAVRANTEEAAREALDHLLRSTGVIVTPDHTDWWHWTGITEVETDTLIQEC